jgi:MFS transporter, DHA1 family, multidrug resistance protein
MASEPARAAAWRTGHVTALIATMSMLQPLATDVYLPTLPSIASAFDVSVSTAQWTLSAFIAAFAGWQLFAGPLSDRIGRAPVIIGGCAIYTLATAVCALAPAIEWFMAGRVLQAVGACSCLVGVRGLVRDLYAPAEGARLIAGAAAFMAIAPLLGPVVGAHLAAAWGWRAVFVLVTVVAAALLGFVLRTLRETNVRRNPHALAPGPMLRTYARVLASPTFRAYALAASATYGGLFAFLAGSSFVLIRVLGLEPTTVGYALALMVSGYLIGTVACRRLLARRGMQHTVYFGAGLQAAAGAAMAGLALAGVHHVLAILVPMFAYFMSHGILQPPVQSGAVAPFADNAGAAAALLGCVMMLVATGIGAWIGASFDGTVYPLTLTIGAASLASLAIAHTLVRWHGDVRHHG